MSQVKYLIIIASDNFAFCWHDFVRHFALLTSFSGDFPFSSAYRGNFEGTVKSLSNLETEKSNASLFKIWHKNVEMVMMTKPESKAGPAPFLWATSSVCFEKEEGERKKK